MRPRVQIPSSPLEKGRENIKKKKLKILVFGNPLVECDSIALRISKKLEKEFPEIEFKEFDTSENLEKEGDHIIILDSAKGLKKVEIIKDLEKLERNEIFSLHDFDLSHELKLLKKIGMIKEFRIIAIPHNMNENIATTQVRNILSGPLDF
jgi:Ni,Fe-hydrogenase maturation factor